MNDTAPSASLAAAVLAGDASIVDYADGIDVFGGVLVEPFAGVWMLWVCDDVEGMAESWNAAAILWRGFPLVANMAPI